MAGTRMTNLDLSIKQVRKRKDVEVKDSEPGETFDQAAISAVEKWEFEPVVEDGSIVEKRAGVRLMFALE